MAMKNLLFAATFVCFATMVFAQDITGSGTKGYIPKFSGTTTVTNSRIFQDGTGVGINTTSPTFTLDVKGTVNSATGFNLAGQPFAFGSFAFGNVFLGFSGNTTNTSDYNTAIGYVALASDTMGSYNTASGMSALLGNTVGSNNTASGAEALINNTTGTANTADGYQSLWSNVGGGGNTAVGDNALYYNSSGGSNTAMGLASGATLDLSNITGSNNSFFGTEAGLSTGTLNNATAIGANAIVSESNALVLGCIPAASSSVCPSLKVGIATATPANIFTIGQGFGQAIADGWSIYSSRRWKTNIEPLHHALSKVEQLRGVSYDLKDSGKHEIGVIAEEVGGVVPEVVSYEKDGNAQGVDYARLTALLIEAVKQQQKEISALRTQLRNHAAREARLESRLEGLEKGQGRTHLASARPVR